MCKFGEVLVTSLQLSYKRICISWNKNRSHSWQIWGVCPLQTSACINGTPTLAPQPPPRPLSPSIARAFSDSHWKSFCIAPGQSIDFLHASQPTLEEPQSILRIHRTPWASFCIWCSYSKSNVQGIFLGPTLRNGRITLWSRGNGSLRSEASLSGL